MLVELDNWKEKQLQLKYQAEYEHFYMDAKEKAFLAYDEYVKQIENKKTSLPNYTERLYFMNNRIEYKAEVYKTTFLRDIIGKYKKSNTTVYQYIKNNHLPAISLQCNCKHVINNSFRRTYTYDEKEFNERCLSTVSQLQQFFGETFLDIMHIPYIENLPNKERYIKRYIDSCLFNSKFADKASCKTGFLTKDKLLIVIEAFYALQNYKKQINEKMKLFKDKTLKELYANNGLGCPGQISDMLVNRVLEGSNVGYDIEIRPTPLPFICITINEYSVNRSIYLNDVNKDLELSIQECVSHCSGFKNYCYHIPPEIYYARDGVRFLSIEEACNFNSENYDYKSLKYYYDKISSWPHNG